MLHPLSSRERHLRTHEARRNGAHHNATGLDSLREEALAEHRVPCREVDRVAMVAVAALVPQPVDWHRIARVVPRIDARQGHLEYVRPFDLPRVRESRRDLVA